MKWERINCDDVVAVALVFPFQSVMSSNKLINDLPLTYHKIIIKLI